LATADVGTNGIANLCGSGQRCPHKRDEFGHLAFVEPGSPDDPSVQQGPKEKADRRCKVEIGRQCAGRNTSAQRRFDDLLAGPEIARP
jgi:hypothetical protein